MNANDNTIAAERLGEIFKSHGKKDLNASRKIAKNVLKNPGIALEIRANVGSAIAF